MTKVTLDKSKNLLYNSDITKRKRGNNIGSGNNKSTQEFERILNDYSLDYTEKEKQIERYAQIFMSK